MSSKKLPHDIPNLIVIIIGSIVSLQISWLIGVIYLILVGVGFFWMGRFICTHCPGGFGKNCPSFYGRVAGKLFNEAKNPDFKKAYHRNIIIVALEWFFPVLTSVISLIITYDSILLISMIGFIVVAFIWHPKESKGDCIGLASIKAKMNNVQEI